MMRVVSKAIFIVGSLTATSAFAGVMDYLSKYNIGIDYASSYDGMNLIYDTDRLSGGLLAENCEASGNVARMECTSHMMGGASSGFGIFLQQPFQRQGDFHFVVDLGVGVRYLNGALNEEETAETQRRGLPLKQASFSLLGLVLKPYVQIGYTPSSRFPDILFSFGPALQISAGQVTINDEREEVLIGTSSGIRGFTELEIVFWRFGEGFLSVFTSKDFSGGGQDGTDIYPHGKDGMDNFKASFSRNVGGSAFGFGVKLLTIYP